MEAHATATLMASVLTLLLAWGGNAPAASPGIEVTAADPPFASQGTINLNVTIKGKGFKSGANASFFVTGTTNEGGVIVNSTTFVSPSQLIANIDVDEIAVISSYDIAVQNADGRTGKGTELFAVTAPGEPQPAPASVLFRDAVSDRIRSDGSGSYADGAGCIGCWQYFAGIFVMRTVNPEASCMVSTRGVVFDFTDAVERSAPCIVRDAYGTTLNVCSWQSVPDALLHADGDMFGSRALAFGIAVKLHLNLQPDTGQNNPAFRLVFESNVRVVATSDPDVRILTTDGAASDVAELYEGGATGRARPKNISLGRFHMPFQVEVRSLE